MKGNSTVNHVHVIEACKHGEIYRFWDNYNQSVLRIRCSHPRMENRPAWETRTCVKWWVGQIPKYHLPMTDNCKLCAWLAVECMNGGRLFEVLLVYCCGKCLHVYMIHCLQRVPRHSRGVPTLHFSHLQDTIMSLIVCCSLVHTTRLLLPLFLARSQRRKQAPALHAKLPATSNQNTLLHRT